MRIQNMKKRLETDWSRFYWDQMNICGLANLTFYASPSFSRLCLSEMGHSSRRNAGSDYHRLGRKPKNNYENPDTFLSDFKSAMVQPGEPGTQNWSFRTRSSRGCANIWGTPPPLTHSWGCTQAQSMGLECQNLPPIGKSECKESHVWPILHGKPGNVHDLP